MKAKHVRLDVGTIHLFQTENICYESAHLVALRCRCPYEHHPKKLHP